MSKPWRTVALGETCDIDKVSHDGGPLPYVGMENIESGTGRLAQECEDTAVKSNTFRFGREHLLYGRLRPYLNKVFLPEGGGHCSTEIFPLRCSGELDRRFLFYWLIQESTVNKINATCTGARMPRANVKEVLNFDFPLPPLSEQKRIVAILDEAFAAIDKATENTEKNLANARELFKSYLHSLFVDRESWESEALVDLCTIGDGNHSSKYPKKSEMLDQGVPFIRGMNLVNGKLSDDDLLYISPKKHLELKKGHLKKGDVLFTNRGEIGKVAIVDDRFDGSNLNSQIAWLRCEGKIFPEYLFYFLQSSAMKRHFEQTKSGAALQQFTIKMLREVKVPFPSLKEQKALVLRCKNAEKDVEHFASILNSKAYNLVELKQSSLRKAFKGGL